MLFLREGLVGNQLSIDQENRSSRFGFERIEHVSSIEDQLTDRLEQHVTRRITDDDNTYHDHKCAKDLIGNERRSVMDRDWVDKLD